MYQKTGSVKVNNTAVTDYSHPHELRQDILLEHATKEICGNRVRLNLLEIDLTNAEEKALAMVSRQQQCCHK